MSKVRILKRMVISTENAPESSVTDKVDPKSTPITPSNQPSDNMQSHLQVTPQPIVEDKPSTSPQSTSLFEFEGKPKTLEHFFSMFTPELLVEFLETFNIEATKETSKDLMIQVIVQKLIHLGVKNAYVGWVTVPNLIENTLKQFGIKPTSSDNEMRNAFFSEIRQAPTLADFFAKLSRECIIEYLMGMNYQAIGNLDKDRLADALSELIMANAVLESFDGLALDFVVDVAKVIGVNINQKHGDRPCILKVLDVAFHGIYAERIDDEIYDMLGECERGTEWEGQIPHQPAIKFGITEFDLEQWWYDKQLERWLLIRDIKCPPKKNPDYPKALRAVILKYVNQGIGNVAFDKKNLNKSKSSDSNPSKKKKIE